MLLQNTSNHKHKPEFMLDSGAFSAWSQGASIDLNEYIAFCLAHLSSFDYIVNLDVIPASPGVKNISKVEIERSASLGWRNYEKMLAAGIPKEKLIHVFHQNEDFQWLERMCVEIPYIGISPANDRTTTEKIVWLDACMKVACDKRGLPRNKWHGFAVTSFRLMTRYPWYSVDSTSWVMTSRMGGVYVPRLRGGQWRYTEDAYKIQVSTRSPSRKEAGKHIETFSRAEQEVILGYFESKGYSLGQSEFRFESDNYNLKEDERWNGKSLAGGLREVERIVEPGLCNQYILRDELNVLFFVELERSLPSWPWPFRFVESSMGFSL